MNRNFSTNKQLIKRNLQLTAHFIELYLLFSFIYSLSETSSSYTAQSKQNTFVHTPYLLGTANRTVK